jgi:hypothetical protein
MQRQRFEAAYRMAPHVKIKKKVANGSSEPFKVSNLKEHFERLTELEDCLKSINGFVEKLRLGSTFKGV